MYNVAIIQSAEESFKHNGKPEKMEHRRSSITYHFGYVLVQFYLSTERIRGLVTPLEASEEDHTKLQIALISQELDNPFWRSVEQGALEAAHEV